MWMYIAAIVFAIFLLIVLVVVISSMRVKSYENSFAALQEENVEKSKQISTLQKELQEFRVKNEKNEQELQQFGKTKSDLEELRLTHRESKVKHGELEKMHHQVQSQLSNKENMYKQLSEDHEVHMERFESMHDDINKLRVNNARLLMKLEQEERITSSAKPSNK